MLSAIMLNVIVLNTIALDVMPLPPEIVVHLTGAAA
jgi:hypothetical protein